MTDKMNTTCMTHLFLSLFLLSLNPKDRGLEQCKAK